MNSQDNPPAGGASSAPGSRTSSPSPRGGGNRDAAANASNRGAVTAAESAEKSASPSAPKRTTGPAAPALAPATASSAGTSTGTGSTATATVSALPASFPSPTSRVSPTATSPLPGIPSPPPASSSQLRAMYYSGRDRPGMSFERPRVSGSGAAPGGFNRSLVHGEASAAGWSQARGQKRQLQQVYEQYPPLSGGGDAAYARPRRTGSPGTSGSFLSRSSAGNVSSAPATSAIAAQTSAAPASSTATKPPRLDLGPPREDPSIYDPPGGDSQSPRDNTRYETWTSKQLRKKCSHLKLRGLKNVKKHVMVEALYRYYRNQRLKEVAASADSASVPTSASMTSPQRRHLQTTRRRSPGGSSSTMNAYGASGGMSSSASGRGNEWPSDGLGAADSRSVHYEDGYCVAGSRGPRAAYTSSSPPGSTVPLVGATNELRLQNARQVMARLAAPSGVSPSGLSYRRYASVDEETNGETLYKEVPVTSEDVVRLVDVVLSPEFVDRLTNELSRWQFWVDIREKYVSLLQRSGPSVDGSSSISSSSGERGGGNAPRNFKWSSMQLWEIWKELTFAYTKTCFEFTAAGMKSVDEQEFINFCDGRPDVYYLHQRLHARPDLLHLIKSNEYIDEKYLNDAAEHQHSQPLAARSTSASASQQQQATQASSSGRGGSMVALMAASTSRLSPHKRYKRSTPTTAQASASATAGGGNASSSAFSGSRTATTAFHSNSGASGGTGNGNSGSGEGNNGNESMSGNDSGDNSGNSGSGSGSGSSGNSPNALQEEGSTENSETTGEDGSNTTANSNASGNSGSSDDALRMALAEQKYFSLLLQNFETIFESLHNKKILLANLRKDKQAPDHLITDLHNDIHVLSALKKEFRNKLRRTLH